jgi:hypothetical protein
MSEYDPLIPDARGPVVDDLERVQETFDAASRPYLSSPWSWFAWAVVLPAAALGTPWANRVRSGMGVLLLWSVAILVGGVVEMAPLLGAGRGTRPGSTPLASWVLRVQGNLSLVAAAISVVLVIHDLAWALPGLWLLLLGHSLFQLGGLAFPAFRTCGLIYQIGGLIALWPQAQPLWVFAAATALGNLWVGLAVVRREREASDRGAAPSRSPGR